MDGGVIGHTLNTMVCIEVLMHGDLENGSPSLSMKIKQSSVIQIMTVIEKNLPARDNAICKEERPESEPSIAVLGNNFVLVADPVFIPTVDSSRVMNTKNVNVFYFETCTLELF